MHVVFIDALSLSLSLTVSPSVIFTRKKMKMACFHQDTGMALKMEVMMT